MTDGNVLLRLCLVSSFTFNPRMAHPDIEFLSLNSDSISCLSLQERVALGSCAFRQGVHYWEFTVQRYDDKPDPAFGIARFDTCKDHMLGKILSMTITY
jgi:tripartite motif-containing protein 9/67